jgi:hypothetical protein
MLNEVYDERIFLEMNGKFSCLGSRITLNIAKILNSFQAKNSFHLNFSTASLHKILIAIFTSFRRPKKNSQVKLIKKIHSSSGNFLIWQSHRK